MISLAFILFVFFSFLHYYRDYRLSLEKKNIFYMAYLQLRSKSYFYDGNDCAYKVTNRILFHFFYSTIFLSSSVGFSPEQKIYLIHLNKEEN